MKIRPLIWLAVFGLIGYYILIRVLFAALPGYSLMSLSFFFLAPFVSGMALERILHQRGKTLNAKHLLIPPLAFWGFGIYSLAAGLEALLCILIMLSPFIAAAIAGFLLIKLLMYLFKKYNEYKEAEENRNNNDGFQMANVVVIPVLLLAPFITGGIENQVSAPLETFHTVTTIDIAASPDKIWPLIVRVSPIGPDEMSRSFFHNMGIPRPLYAELHGDSMGGTRIGHFEEGLRLVEKVTTWQPGRQLALDVQIDASSISNSVFDQHILKGGYFFIRTAGYSLQALPGGGTRLSLNSTYQLRSHFNPYPKLWGDWALNDFQSRLLGVIKHRAENNK